MDALETVLITRNTQLGAYPLLKGEEREVPPKAAANLVKKGAAVMAVDALAQKLKRYGGGLVVTSQTDKALAAACKKIKLPILKGKG